MSASTTCLHCGTELPPRAGTSGRPPDYCGTVCRQAAYRTRRRLDPGAGQASTAADTAVRELAQDVLEEARHLIRLLTRPDAPLLDPVEQAVNLNRSVELLTVGLVGRARLRRVPWGRLGPSLAMRPDTARRTYRADAISRRLRNVPRPRPAGEPPAAGPGAADPAPPAVEPRTPNTVRTNRSRSHLAPVLSRLQRASQLPLRTLAARLGISPSQASRILSGERFPSWRLTEHFARACGADPLVLRTVWEKEKLREEHAPDASAHFAGGGPEVGDDPVERLRVALHTLHIKAGRPAPDVLAEATRHTLLPGEISAVLAGRVPHWSLLADLVQTLDGDPAYFQPLWEATSFRRRVPPGAPPPAERPAAPRPPSADERLLRLFQVFGPVLATAPGRRRSRAR